ncbi:amidohydrolase [Avrilella dinanensis]|uniref:Transcriptional regulator n=1 Tax=Avrilella dinanensis TaxID=2008672 RepID=A0A2M9R5G0_9FLAO|nr:amidohydrolase [Avrilella dinanensis]PJR04080.1 transcriptional regulator [Avrilella dinanensis]
MKKIFTIVVAIIFAINANAQSDKQLIGADLIVFNAKITTGSLTKPEASALAVKRGRIYAVGTDSEILELKDNNTKLIDAHSRRLIPGINDAHTHLLNERSYNYNVRWEGVPTLKRALEMLSEQAKRTPEGQWVKVIGGWSPYQFEENRLPTIEEIKKAVPNRPVIVQYAYNRAYLNELAMEAFGVGTDKFPDSPDTIFEKDKNGKYTGVMHSYTFTFAALELMVPQPSEEEQLSSIANAIHDMNRFGVTTAVDAASIYGYPHGHVPIQELAKENRLNIRMPFIDLQFGDTSSPSLVDAQINAVTRKSPISAGENLHPHMAHGHVYEGTGEILRLEIHDHENFDRPAVIIDKELMHRYIKEDITKLIEKGIPFRLHISYNENITSFLDALEEINNKTPLDGLRWSIEHAETITPENIARVKKLGGGIALDMKMAMHGDGFIKTHGIEKALQTPRLRQLVDSGIPLAITTDAFRASSYNPWIGISWMITGKSVSGSEILAKNNRLTREEALRLVTVGPTWFENQESEMGKIIPGNLADFALLNKDFFTIPEDEIKTISSVLTVLDGRIVFGEEEYSKLSPKLPETLPTWSPVKYFGGYYNTKN